MSKVSKIRQTVLGFKGYLIYSNKEIFVRIPLCIKAEYNIGRWMWSTARGSVGKWGQKAVASQSVKFLVPLHSLFHTTNSCCLPYCRPISHSNIEQPLLAKQGLETRKFVCSEN